MDSSTERERAFSEYEENLELLTHIPFFAVMPVEALKVTAYLCRREAFKAGDALFQQDEVDDHAYYFLEGAAALLRKFDLGEEKLRAFGAGDFLGGLSLLSGAPRLFSLKAETPLTCLVLAGEEFRKTLERFPEAVSLVMNEAFLQIHRWEYDLVVQHAAACPRCKSAVGVTLI